MSKQNHIIGKGLSCVRGCEFDPKNSISCEIRDNNRFKLTVALRAEGKESNAGKAPGEEKADVVVIGYNPSTAHEGKSDRTLTITAKTMRALGFNKMLMLNLYTQISSTKDGINCQNETIVTDFAVYRDSFEGADAIVVAWGKDADLCPEAEAAREFLSSYGGKVFCIEENGRRPLHPRVWRYNRNYHVAAYPC